MVVNLHAALKTTEYTNQLGKKNFVSLVVRFVTFLGTIMAKRIGNCHEVTCMCYIKLFDVVATT
jgi:hypothetical protein